MCNPMLLCAQNPPKINEMLIIPDFVHQMGVLQAILTKIIFGNFSHTFVHFTADILRDRPTTYINDTSLMTAK